MITIAIAFSGHHKTSEGTCLYVGHDYDAAIQASREAGEGVAVCHIYRGIQPLKRVTPDAVSAPVVEDQELADEAPEKPAKSKAKGD